MIYSGTILQRDKLRREATQFNITPEVLGDRYEAALSELNMMLDGVHLDRDDRISVEIDIYLEEWGVKPFLRNKATWEGEPMPTVRKEAVQESSGGGVIPIFNQYDVVKFKCESVTEETDEDGVEKWNIKAKVLQEGDFKGATKYLNVKFTYDEEGNLAKIPSNIMSEFGREVECEDDEGNKFPGLDVTPADMSGKEFQATAGDVREYQGKQYQSFFKFVNLTADEDKIPF